jgi:hypothetical protein
MPKLASTASISADENAREVLQLIADYQRCARAAVAALRRQTRATDLLAALRKGQIKRSGRLQERRARYSFHGIGCRFEMADRVIDVEFGPSGRHDGFDSWKLQQFAESAFEWRHLTARAIESGIKQLRISRVATHPNLEPSPHLIYLTEDLAQPKKL